MDRSESLYDTAVNGFYKFLLYAAIVLVTLCVAWAIIEYGTS